MATRSNKKPLYKYLVEAPKGATHFKDGLFYKIGLHGFLYRYGSGDWVKVTLSRTNRKAETEQFISTTMRIRMLIQN